MELIVLLAAILLGGAILLGLLKFLFWAVLLPFKAAFWVVKGIIGLVFLVPFVAIFACVLSTAVPVLLTLLALPIVLALAGVVALARWIF